MDDMAAAIGQRRAAQKTQRRRVEQLIIGGHLALGAGECHEKSLMADIKYDARATWWSISVPTASLCTPAPTSGALFLSRVG
jgi:hypothetical protein